MCDNYPQLPLSSLLVLLQAQPSEIAVGLCRSLSLSRSFPAHISFMCLQKIFNNLVECAGGGGNCVKSRRKAGAKKG